MNLDEAWNILDSQGIVALGVPKDDNVDNATLLTQLSARALDAYHRTKHLRQMDTAIRLSRTAMTLTPQDDPQWYFYVANYGGQLAERYERTRKDEDLEACITVLRPAVDAVPSNSLAVPGLLTNYGTMLGFLYDKSGELRHLEEAISLYRRAADALSANDPARVPVMQNLGVRLNTLSQVTGMQVYLQEGINITRQALEILPSHLDPLWAPAARALSALLFTSFQRTHSSNIAYLDESIDLLRRAIASTLVDHPNLAEMTYNLGAFLASRHKINNRIADLDEAVDVTRKALEIMPPDHADRGRILANLGAMIALQDRQRRVVGDGGIAGPDATVALIRQALAIIPDHHPDKDSMAYNLGVSLVLRRKANNLLADVDEATDCFLRLWNSVTTPPLLRLRAATNSMDHLVLQSKRDLAIQLGKDAISLLPVVNTKMLSHQDQQYVVSVFTMLASRLCSLLLDAGETEDALKYLEQGRAVILGHLIDSRSDISSLAQNSPDLARRYERLRDEVNTPLRGGRHGVPETHQIDQRRQIISDLEKHIEHIRTVPGHHDFLMGPTLAEMQACMKEGAKVVVNISLIWSDAIIITPTTVRVLQLTEMLRSDTRSWAQKDWNCSRRQRGQTNKEYIRYLAWLWTSCVEPVLAIVQSLQIPPANKPPRVWWIGCGEASFLPFHAAGIHRKGSEQTAYHQSISSYAPSIKALSHAEKRAEAMPDTHGSLLVVTMPTTPGLEGQKTPRPLNGVVDEKNHILDAVKGHLHTTYLKRPSVNDVIEALPECSIAHFACHGSSDAVDPSNSGLILQKPSTKLREEVSGDRLDTNTAAVQDRLTVGRILQVNLQGARLAYLSACSTAQNEAEKLADEVIHVVSGFQIAGFPHVVGCLWPSNDDICVEIAVGFYTRLLSDVQPGGKWADERVAVALREAVMEVREREMGAPLDWAPYVHYGP
ncbi:CHAT domain-containing protein [Plectosphaerella plurivora]|uniref:CHAT domain-containing protein n=1 Tax=Plectosphaerella plurivora TaxID=936078 RepID=A0A9P8V1L0_9PEZI|nr:CHAT domain-containing protein [Plectosphaerella plurivora]